MISNRWAAIILSQLWVLPNIAVLLVGIILAAMRWRQHPQVSMTAIVGFALLLASQLMWMGFAVAQRLFLFGAGSTAFAFLAMRFLNIILGTAGLALLVMAIFGWRAAIAAPPKRLD